MKTLDELIFFSRQIGDQELDYSFVPFQVVDGLFEIVRSEIEITLLLLNTARNHIKQNISTPQELSLFQAKWQALLGKIAELTTIVERDKLLLKLAKAFVELLIESTQRKLLTKLPSPPIDYLLVSPLEVEDIDWIIRKIKDYWQKFCQIYSAIRVELVLKMK